jgi:hypothetical protein
MSAQYKPFALLFSVIFACLGWWFWTQMGIPDPHNDLVSAICGLVIGWLTRSAIS